MSTTEWTNPQTGIKYPIGNVGIEPIKPNGIFGEILDVARTAFPPFNLAYLTLSAILTKGDSAVPTYGLWAGPGWNAGTRPTGDEIDWTTPPCYNENVKTSSTPENCYSLVDAITKTHDWRYYKAEIDYPNRGVVGDTGKKVSFSTEER